MTPDQLDFFTEQTKRAVHKSLRAHTRNSVIGFLVLLAGIGYAVHDSGHRAYKTRSVLCALITRGDSALYQYGVDGTITQAQLQRGLEGSAEARKALSPGRGCTDSITPPPPNLAAPGQHPHG